MNKTVNSIVSTLMFCFWNSGDLRAEETDVKSLPPIQFAEGEKRFTTANQNASTSLSKYLDWSLYGILFSGGMRGRTLSAPMR